MLGIIFIILVFLVLTLWSLLESSEEKRQDLERILEHKKPFFDKNLKR